MTTVLYYTVCKYTKESMKLLLNNFHIVQVPDPRWDNTIPKHNLEAIEAIFFPLGYRFEPIHAKRFPNLKVIASNTTNTDHITVNADYGQTQRVISLKGDTDFLMHITPTAEHTWGLIHACHRNLLMAADDVHEGHWDRYRWGAPKMLSRMTLGIVGMGRVGCMVASFGREIMEIINWYDPSSSNTELGIQRDSLISLASKSDILTIHASNLPENKNMINKEVFNAMPKGSIVVNTAHGDLLHIGDLLDALNSGQLRAAALDVLPGEYRPDFKHSSVLGICSLLHPRLILTPHIAGSTEDAWQETQTRVIEKVVERLK